MNRENSKAGVESVDGCWIASVDDRRICIFNRATGEKIAKTEQLSTQPYSLKFSSKGDLLCYETCSNYYYAYQDLYVWDFTSGTITRSNIAEEHRDAIIHCSDDLKFAVCKDDEKPYFSVWDLATGQVIARLGDFGSDFVDTWLIADGMYVAATANKKYFYLWRIHDQYLVNVLELNHPAKKIELTGDLLEIRDRKGKLYCLSFHH